MEIRDYLRQIRRYLWLLIVIPVVAALATGGFVEIRPSVYQADASVVVPAISANGFSQSAASQYVNTFKDVLVSQPVLTDVSQKYKIPTSELASGLSASTVTSSSNIINVVLVGKDHQNLPGAVREATVDSLNAIAAPRFAQAQNASADAQALLDTANTNYDKWISSTQDVAPQIQFNNALTQLNSQTANQQVAKAHHDANAYAAATALITYYKGQVATYGALLEQYTALENAKAAALSVRSHAAQQLNDAQALINTDAAPATVHTYNIGRLSKLADTIKFAAIAFALALLMLLGLLLILELMRPARRAVATAAPKKQGAFAWDAPLAQPSTDEVSEPVSVPVAASVASGGSATPPALLRDPWRASPAAVVVGGNGNGNGHSNGNGHANGNGNGHANGNGHVNGNGNGHANGNGNGNGNGHAGVVFEDGDADLQRSGAGLTRR